MPLPGTANNGLGINSFSGPMGEKEPAYGAGERLKMLTALAPIGSPAALGAPKRAKRAAAKGKTSAPAPTPLPASPASTQQPAQPTYQAQVIQFWQEVAQDPAASPQIKQYAQQVAGVQAA